MKAQKLDYQNFSTTDLTPESKQTSFMLLRWLRKIGEVIVNTLAAQEQPRIYAKRNRMGESYWQIYDPRTCHTTYLGSEQETRIWLDKRFYQK